MKVLLFFLLMALHPLYFRLIEGVHWIGAGSPRLPKIRVDFPRDFFLIPAMSESASSSSFVPSRPSASRRLSRSPAPLDMLAWTPQVERGADMVGEVLGGRFVVTGRIGRGGMSWVFACEDRLLRGKAAVKVLRTPEAGARRRFLAEARVLARVRHPRLVQVLAAGETEDGGPFMAMECLEGPSLEDRLRSGPLGWREAVEVGIQVADALATLHAAGVIHRDVKPSNLVQVPSATGRISVKVIDLGVAKVLGGSPVLAGGSSGQGTWRTTEAGIAVGTRGYCAPEAGLCEADARLDVYGLGGTLFQICTGALPRRGERWRRMGEVRPEAAFPAGLEALVEAMVASDPEVRVGSMVEVVRRLEAVAGAGATADVVDDTEGLFAGRYEVLEPLGVGAFAEVVRAYDREAERYVALKRLRAGAAATEEERRRLVVEARALGAVRDPALPELYECRTGARGGVPFVAMSVARGQAASEFCLAGRTLKIAEAIAVGRQVAG
ncbi:MAG TPA: protein kinase, partial [Nannocystaceae bacterium]|nr:protein kinase [Nannocystaceae bacterium]